MYFLRSALTLEKTQMSGLKEKDQYRIIHYYKIMHREISAVLLSPLLPSSRILMLEVNEH